MGKVKGSIKKGPHHRLPNWIQVQFLYNGLKQSIRSMFDAVAGGMFMNKSPEEGQQLL